MTKKSPMTYVLGCRLPHQLIQDLEILSQHLNLKRSALIRLMLADGCRRLAKGQKIGAAPYQVTDTSSMLIREIAKR